MPGDPEAVSISLITTLLSYCWVVYIILSLLDPQFSCPWPEIQPFSILTQLFQADMLTQDVLVSFLALSYEPATNYKLW